MSFKTEDDDQRGGLETDWNVPVLTATGYYGRLVDAFYHASRFVHDTKWEPSPSNEATDLSWDELKSCVWLNHTGHVCTLVATDTHCHCLLLAAHSTTPSHRRILWPPRRLQSKETTAS